VIDRRRVLAGIAASTAALPAHSVRAQTTDTVNMGKLIGLTDAAFYVARRFFIGYLRGLRYYHDALIDGKLAGPTADDVIATVQAEIKLPDATVWKSVVPSALQTNGRVDAPSLQFDYEVFRELGLIQTPVSVANAIDMQFADDANIRLGPYHSR
jgi:hypothetical protein